MNSKRLFLKAAAWTAPVISTITMPVHAQATPQACSFPDSMAFDITSLTTTDDRGGTETPTATLALEPNAVSSVFINLSGDNVTMIIEIVYLRTSNVGALSSLGAGSTEMTGTIDRDSGMISIDSIGATVVHPDLLFLGTPEPQYYVPTEPFSFSLPCGATTATLEFTAGYLSATSPVPTSGFTNVYNLALR